MPRRTAAALGAAVAVLLVGCGGPTGSRTAGPVAVTSAPPAADVPTYHQDGQRSGLRADTPPPTVLRVGWDHDLDGAVYAQPLVVGGLVIVATEHDSIYAFDAATGAPRWHTSLGVPQPAAALPCGNIAPTVGVTGTPVYDAGTGWVYAVAEEAGPRHELVAVDARTGAVTLRQDVDLGAPGTDPAAMQQRSALADAGGRVYVSFGGREGDCGAYRGQVIGVPVRGGPPVSYTVPTVREAGAWNASGPAVDAAGEIYVAVGNGSTAASYDHSDAVLRFTPALALDGFFAPADWRAQNAGDVDLGATGPTLLPGGLLLAIGKSPSVYVLRQSALGGIGGALSTARVCAGYGGTAHDGNVVFLPCTDGVRAVSVSAAGAVTVRWRADPVIDGSPVVGGGAVFALDRSGTLHVLAEATGRPLGTVRLPAATTRFATPALWRSEAFVGTVRGITAVSGV